MTTDTITVLRSMGPILTKRWTAEGSILATERAKMFTVEDVPFTGIEGLAQELRRIAADPRKAVIRGAFIDDKPDANRNYAERDLERFAEHPRRWVCFDIDGFEPVLSDPVSEPADAVVEFIQTKLPNEFAGCSHFWQLSSSAGAPGKGQYLKCHLWFLWDRPITGQALETWARVLKVPIDKTTLRTVQLHYVADPVIDDGALCPITQRSGLHIGNRETVPLVLPDEADAFNDRLNQPAGPGRTMQDPGAKPGLIGAFCRAYPPARLINDGLLVEFTWETDENSPRLTWGGGHGAEGGACITDDGQHIYNSHDSDPFAGRAVNSWDMVRQYSWGHLDGDDPSVYEFAGPAALPSDQAMRAWARGLSDVQAELPDAMEAARERYEARQPNVAEIPNMAELPDGAHSEQTEPSVRNEHHGARVEKQLRAMLSLEDGRDLPFDPAAFDAQLARVAWEPARGQFKIMTPSGEVLQSAKEDLALIMRERFPPIHDPAALETAALDRAAAREMGVVAREKFVKEVLSVPYGRLSALARAHRQFTVIDAGVDIFAADATMALRDGRLSLLFRHEDLRTGPVDGALIADYRDHWRGLDDYLDLLVASRFASNRKAAHLWMHAASDWGKNFLVDALSHHGLVYSTSPGELEKALAGGPVGLTLEGMRRVWVLFVDEFKGVTKELKQLSSELTFSPKNQTRVTVPLYLKHFASAEDVPSLASEESGIEAQFANRFMYMDAPGVLSTRPVFAADKGRYFRAVCAYIGAEINRRVATARALGRDAAGLAAEQTLARLHTRYLLGNAIEGGAGTLEEKVPEIARQYASDMVLAFTRGGQSGSISDAKARSDVFTHAGAYWMRRCGSALDAWLDETYGRGEGAKIKYKRRHLLAAIGESRAVRVSPEAIVKARCLGVLVPTADPLA